MAVGLASGEAAMFHLFTHAFFKALLFLGAGSIIVMLHHEQNIWKMGGLAGRLGITFLTFMVGTLALIGFPPFSGFFSKDAILALAYEKNPAIFWLALFTAFLTAFYMLRLVVVVFFGRPRSDQARAGREAPWVMITPLILLAISRVRGRVRFFRRNFSALPGEKEIGWLVPGMAIAATLAGMTLAILLYRRRESDPINLALFRKGFYFDEIYGFLIAATQGVLARLSALIDRWILDRRRCPRRERRDLGFRLAAQAAPGREPAGLCVSLRFGNRWPDLLHTFPVILLFIVFCPIVAALAILLGAPARRTALWAAGLDARRDTAAAYLAFQTGRRRFSIRLLASDQQRLADQLRPWPRWPEPDDALADRCRHARGHLVHRRDLQERTCLLCLPSPHCRRRHGRVRFHSISFSSTRSTSSR